MDEQHVTDVEQARQRLQQAQETRDARKDPRMPEASLLPPKAPTPEELGIRPVTGKPLKKTFGRRLKEAIFSEDIGNGSVTDYAFFKIMIPAAKRVLCETLNTMINMAFGLDPRTRTIGTSANVHTANASVYRDRNFSRPAMDGYGYGGRRSFSEEEWDEATATDIYHQIVDQIELRGQCSLELAYSIAGLSERIRTTDRHWGWTSTEGIGLTPVDAMKTRWIVDMPPVRQLSR